MREFVFSYDRNPGDARVKSGSAPGRATPLPLLRRRPFQDRSYSYRIGGPKFTLLGTRIGLRLHLFAKRPTFSNNAFFASQNWPCCRQRHFELRRVEQKKTLNSALIADCFITGPIATPCTKLQKAANNVFFALRMRAWRSQLHI